MGNTIDKVDDGLYICGVIALDDFGRLDALGIKCILNAASMDLYKHLKHNSGEELVRRYEVKALEAMDSEDCNLSVHFEEAADFIERGIRKGGVVVHCAAGISRATSSLCAYLMLKRRLSADAAFAMVHSRRSVVNPNPGFWRQLRDLEAVLTAFGEPLVPMQPERLTQATLEAIASLDRRANSKGSFVTHYLTARVTLQTTDDATSLPSVRGCVWVELVPDGESQVLVRAKCVPSMDGRALESLLRALPGVAEAVAEASEES